MNRSRRVSLHLASILTCAVRKTLTPHYAHALPHPWLPALDFSPSPLFWQGILALRSTQDFDINISRSSKGGVARTLSVGSSTTYAVPLLLCLPLLFLTVPLLLSLLSKCHGRYLWLIRCACVPGRSNNSQR